MFTPPCVDIVGLDWAPIGPGADPAVLLEAALGINGISFRLLAFRVPMPYSAGWTAHSEWEDDKGLQTDGLLWHPQGFRELIDAVDSMPDDSGETFAFESVPQDADEATLALAEAWLGIVTLLGWSGQDWRPAIITDNPYIVLGHPANAGPVECLRVSRDLPQERHAFGSLNGLPEFNVRIEGAICALRCAEVRAMQQGGRHVIRPLSPRSAVLLRTLENLVGLLPGGSPLLPFRIGAHAVTGCIVPIGAAVWSFDFERFLESASSGLAPGRARWWFDLPLRAIDPALARLLEDIAARVRTRKLGRIAGGAYVAYRMEEAAQISGLGEDHTAIRSTVGQGLGRLFVHAFGQVSDGMPWAHSGHVCDRVYVIGDHIYVNLATSFLLAADGLPFGMFLDLPHRAAVVETQLAAAPLRPPQWLALLPPIIDTPIRDLISSLAASE